MLKRTFKGVVHILAGLLAGAAIVLLTFAWVLSRGPLSLGFLSPYVGQLINNALPGVEAEFDDTILTWAGWERAIDLRVINLSVRADEGSVLAQIPEVAFSLSTKALVRGVIAPSRVELFGPTLYAIRETDGHFNLALAGAGAMASGSLGPFLTQLTGSTNPDDPLNYLTRIDISNADLIIEDTGLGRSWVTPDTQISLRRNGARIDGETSFLIDLDGKVAEVSLVGAYDATTRRIDAGLSFGGITPSVLAGSAPEIGFLKYIAVPVQGTVTLASSVDGVLESVGFDVSGSDGTLRLPPPLGGDLRTRHFSLRGHFDATQRRLDIEKFSANFAPETRLHLPEPFNHDFPLSGFSITAGYDGLADSLAVHTMDVDLSGVTVEAIGTVDQLLTMPQVLLSVFVPEISVAQIRDYWPSSVGADAYSWITTQVESGIASNLHADIEGAVQENGEFVLSTVDGGFDVRDATMHYVDALPVITEFDATARFTRDQINLDVKRAHSAGLDLEIGNVSMTELSGDTEHANITAVVTGPFRKAMKLMDGEPLNFAKALNIDPSSANGVIRADLEFDFPMKKTLEWGEVKASATAELESVAIPDGLFGLDVDEGRLELSINNDGMAVSGELLLQNFPTILTWQQNFKDTAEFRNRYEMSVHVTDVQNITDLGIDVSPFSADMIRGEVPVNVHVVETNEGLTELDARASLDGVIMHIPAINWFKEEQDPGEAQVSIQLRNNAITAIPKFSIKTDDLVIEGSAHYAPGSGKLNRIEMTNIKYGRTRMSALLVPGNGKIWAANFTGSKLDLDPVWDDIVFGDFTESGQAFMANVSVTAKFDQVWLSDDRAMDNVVAAFSREEEIMRTVYITADVKGGAPLEIKMAPSDKSPSRILTVWSSDAGEVLRTFDLYDLMKGGELSLAGQLDDTQEDHPFSGLLDIQRYRIVEAPTLARLVSLMALTGILESLQGEGLAFDALSMPFDYTDGIIRLSDAKATGKSLGFTADGTIYTHADAVDITGTMVPAYAINSALGNLPLIGSIFTGGEEGGGIFAANYTMTGPRSDPDVSINPLSALTPGFLRNIFGIFDGGPEPAPVVPGSPPSAVTPDAPGADAPEP